MPKLFLLLHLIGIGMVLTLIFAAPIFEKTIRRVTEYKEKLNYQLLLRKIGLLTPFGSLLIVLSGIGNMYYGGFTVFSHGWLTAKIILFAVLVVNGGMLNPPLTRKRAKLFEEMVGGKVPENAGQLLARYNRQQSLFLLVQTVVVLIVLCLAVFKPA